MWLEPNQSSRDDPCGRLSAWTLTWRYLDCAITLNSLFSETYTSSLQERKTNYDANQFLGYLRVCDEQAIPWRRVQKVIKIFFLHLPYLANAERCEPLLACLHWTSTCVCSTPLRSLPPTSPSSSSGPVRLHLSYLMLHPPFQMVFC